MPLADGYVHDLDAMLEEVTAATQLLIVCNPNNPTGTYLPAERIGAFVESVPDRTTVILDEAYIEYQTTDDPDATLDLLREAPQPGAPAHLQQVPTGSPACASATRSAHRSSAPRSTPSASPSASTPSPRRPAPRRSATRTTSPTGSRRTWSSGVFVEEELRELGFATAESQANFSWIDLGDRDEAEVVEALTQGGRRRPAGRRRSAAPATCGSPTARAPRTSASSRPSVS